jgi:threonine dehydrogenase-like Zn-dependent dehydrogenase
VAIEALGLQVTFENALRCLRPGGKERMRRLMSQVQSKRFDPRPLITHSFKLSQIVEAYELFGSRCDGVLKVAIRP